MITLSTGMVRERIYSAEVLQLLDFAAVAVKTLVVVVVLLSYYCYRENLLDDYPRKDPKQAEEPARIDDLQKLDVGCLCREFDQRLDEEKLVVDPRLENHFLQGA